MQAIKQKLTQTTATKPGYLTSEFWFVIVANVLTQLKTLPFPAHYNWIVLVGSLVGYSLSRGLAKINLPTDPAAVDPAAAPVPDEPADVSGL